MRHPIAIHKIAALCLLGLWIAGSGSAAAAAGIRWYSYEEGAAESRSSGKKLFLHFYADWCGFCEKMEKETFSKPSVIAFLNAHFIPVKVDSDKQKEVAASFYVRGLPTTWFISESGERLGSRPGYIGPDELMPILQYIQTDSYKTMGLKEFLQRKEPGR